VTTAEPAAVTPRPTIRVGQGFDVHAFSDDPERRLVLGGCTFDGERGLVGHSDADVVAHACADALLGAAGLGDIGMHFPDTDPRWSGADSLRLLAATVEMVTADGWEVGNVDVAVVCERPKLAPRRDEMQRVLAEVVGAPVSIKGNRAEGLGAIGRAEGVVCFAVAVLVRWPAGTGAGS
jgi:2-C-methyl-D-erythritol 2,4-cyclodiphosphate synthase